MSKEGMAQPKQKSTPSSITEDQPNLQPKPRAQKPQQPSSSQLSQKQKLIDQNIKLKTQIYDLSRQLDEIMGKDQSKKKKYGAREDEDDDTTKQKKIELRKQELEVMSLKNKIHAIKRQLETVYNNRVLQAKEDELKYLRNQLEGLQEQKKSLLKIKNEQAKILKVTQNQEEYEDKIQELKKQLHGLREESKTLNDKLMESERILRKNHQQFIVKQSRVKELEQKLLSSQLKSKKRKPIQTVTPQMIQKLQQQITQLQQQRKQTQKSWYDKISAIDLELREKKMQEEKKLMLLKQKEKELKLNELKIKQLRKLIKHNITENSERVSQDLDMHQFRYKRNIKYMKE